MYAWLWRKLPGPWPVKLIWSAAGVAAVVALLFTVVFPWVEPRLPFSNVTVDDSAANPQSSADTLDPAAEPPTDVGREITIPAVPSGSPRPTQTGVTPLAAPTAG